MNGTCLVARILRSSAVDGPGNRAVVFLQTCNFDCVYCHNPETRVLCSSCGVCLSACQYGALSLQDQVIRWDKSRCRDCGACLLACPHSSSPKTRRMRIDEVMAEILPWRAFLRGITISGGECLLQPKCTTALLEAARQAGLPGLVDTNGSTQLSSLPQLVLAAAGFMLDIKAWDQNEHRALTGMDNEVVLANLDFLIPTGKLLEVRTVVTEGLFDSRQTVREVSRRIALAPNPVCYRIIAFRPEGVRSRGKKLCHPPAAEEMETLRTIALSEGVRQVALIASDSFSPPSPITS